MTTAQPTPPSPNQPSRNRIKRGMLVRKISGESFSFTYRGSRLVYVDGQSINMHFGISVVAFIARVAGMLDGQAIVRVEPAPDMFGFNEPWFASVYPMQLAPTLTKISLDDLQIVQEVAPEAPAAPRPGDTAAPTATPDARDRPIDAEGQDGALGATRANPGAPGTPGSNHGAPDSPFQPGAGANRGAPDVPGAPVADFRASTEHPAVPEVPRWHG